MSAASNENRDARVGSVCAAAISPYRLLREMLDITALIVVINPTIHKKADTAMVHKAGVLTRCFDMNYDSWNWEGDSTLSITLVAVVRILFYPTVPRIHPNHIPQRRRNYPVPRRQTPWRTPAQRLRQPLDQVRNRHPVHLASNTLHRAPRPV